MCPHSPQLRSKLEHALVAPNRLAKSGVFSDTETQRLLEEDVLSGPGGFDRLQDMPLIGTGDRNGVDVLPGEQIAVIAINHTVAATVVIVYDATSFVGSLAVDIAYRQDAATAMAQEGAQVLRTTSSHADAAQRDPVGCGLPL